MEELTKVLDRYLDDQLQQIVLSAPKKGREESKVKLRPILHRGELRFQAEIQRGTKAFHENLTKEEALPRLAVWMEGGFGQLQLTSEHGSVSVLVSKKGHMTIKEKRAAQNKEQNSAQNSERNMAGQSPAAENTVRSPRNLQHNRTKHYLLEEGHPVPFLVDLGVMTAEGRIVHKYYDKFRQINRFLEFIEDILSNLPRDREISILDFGCGKSYLTFAMYYYLRECRGLDVRILGLDLKADVIARCNALAERYSYEKLSFLEGDIAGYEDCTQVDMVVTLHACDTATDYALYKAICWDARVILSVPCCQHELNGQITDRTLDPILKYGILKERFAALATDGLRASLLELQGYDTQILEFIDMEHTPKNLLIRAVKRQSENVAREEEYRARRLEEYERCAEEIGALPTLERLLEGRRTPLESRKAGREKGVRG